MDLEKLLAFLQPKLLEDDFVFCTSKTMSLADALVLEPVASYREEEGLSLVLTKRAAMQAGFDFSSVFKCITLTVHSSLDSVGLTAAVANRLSSHSISANVVAAFYHDHVFVPSSKADQALSLLSNFQN
jgi:hypothetical protein